MHALLLVCAPVCDDPQSVQMHASIMALLFGCWSSAGMSDLAASWVVAALIRSWLARVSLFSTSGRQALVVSSFPPACNAFSLVSPSSVSYWTAPLLFYCATLMQLGLKATFCCAGSCQPNLGTCFLRIN